MKQQRLNFKRASTSTLYELYSRRKQEGGWNQITMDEIEAELKYRNHIPHEGPCDTSCDGHFDN
jgi:hypothetical protein